MMVSELMTTSSLITLILFLTGAFSCAAASSESAFHRTWNDVNNQNKKLYRLIGVVTSRHANAKREVAEIKDELGKANSFLFGLQFKGHKRKVIQLLSRILFMDGEICAPTPAHQKNFCLFAKTVSEISDTSLKLTKFWSQFFSFLEGYELMGYLERETKEDIYATTNAIDDLRKFGRDLVEHTRPNSRITKELYGLASEAYWHLNSADLSRLGFFRDLKEWTKKIVPLLDILEKNLDKQFEMIFSPGSNFIHYLDRSTSLEKSLQEAGPYIFSSYGAYSQQNFLYIPMGCFKAGRGEQYYVTFGKERKIVGGHAQTGFAEKSMCLIALGGRSRDRVCVATGGTYRLFGFTHSYSQGDFRTLQECLYHI